MVEDTPIYTNASAASVWMLWAHNVRVTPEHIRQLAQRGKLSRLPDGKNRYDLVEIEKYLLRRAEDGRAGT